MTIITIHTILKKLTQVTERLSKAKVQAMYVCLCKGITDTQIREAVQHGANSMKAIRQELDVMSQCGKCACDVHAILQSTSTTKTHSTPMWSVA